MGLRSQFDGSSAPCGRPPYLLVKQINHCGRVAGAESAFRGLSTGERNSFDTLCFGAAGAAVADGIGEASTTFILAGPTGSCMGTLLANAAVVVILALFGGALFAMTLEDYALAGVLFLSASIVIYYRENRLIAD